MGLVLVVAVLTLVAGTLCGGRPSGLAALQLRGSALLVAAVAFQVIGGLVLSGAAYGAALLAGAVLAGAFVGRNIRTPGLALVGLGLACNALVVAVNGAMPVSERAAERAGVSGALQLADDPRHAPITPDTRLAWLGDIVPVASPVRPEVVSCGDLLVAAGVAQLLWVGMRGGRRQAPQLR